MGKLLLLILLVLAAFLVVKSLKRAGGRPDSSAGRKAAERMLSCAWCGVNLPESEGVRGGDKFFCSEDHRRLGA